jgi:hypothetical protein
MSSKKKLRLVREGGATVCHSASFFKLNHFFSFGFSGCGGVRGVFAVRPSLRAPDQVAQCA